jgi:hypothetical protein
MMGLSWVIFKWVRFTLGDAERKKAVLVLTKAGFVGLSNSVEVSLLQFTSMSLGRWCSLRVYCGRWRWLVVTCLTALIGKEEDHPKVTTYNFMDGHERSVNCQLGRNIKMMMPLHFI